MLPSRAMKLVVALAFTLVGWLPASSSGTELGVAVVDRVLAVVDDDPILASEVEREGSLGRVERRPEETDAELERRTLDLLIDERVRRHEVQRFGRAEVPVAEIEHQVEIIRRRFADLETFRAELARRDLDETGLRQLVARQLATESFFREILGPRVQIDRDDIQLYYDSTLVPELEARGEPVPPLDEVREDIRTLLRAQRLNREIERRTEELRNAADIVDFLVDERRGLPPLVGVVEPGDPRR
jgi:hypothetical protein